MNYFFDNCISPKFVAMLTSLEVNAVALRESFDSSIDDPLFLRRLKEHCDVYITYDHKQKSREIEADAIKESGVIALWIGPFWGKKSFWDQAKWLVTRWEKIDSFSSGASPGTTAVIQENGKSRAFRL